MRQRCASVRTFSTLLMRLPFGKRNTLNYWYFLTCQKSAGNKYTTIVNG